MIDFPPHKDLDVLVVGRAAIDLYSDQTGRALEDVELFRRSMGGCAGNIAVGAARLGLKTALLTRVGDEPMGTFVTRFLAAEGVDVSRVQRDSHHLTGLVLLGIDPPKNFPILFFRENCADLQLATSDVDADQVRRAKAVVLTGTAFCQDPSRTTNHAIARQAVDLGARLVLDLDYRPMFWSGSDAAQKEIAPVLPIADLVVGTEDEVRMAGRSTDVAAATDKLRREMRGILVVKRGEHGSEVYPPSGKAIHQEPFRVQVLNVLGAGDAFMSGFLYGWLRGWDLTRAARLANAAGAIVVTRQGCAPAMPTLAEAEALASKLEGHA